MAGIPTAWVATWSQGTGKPVIALGSDLDGIPLSSQKPGVSYRDEIVPGAPGHGEGHNSGQVVNIIAALAVRDVMKRENLSGTIKLWPGVAEELLAALRKAGIITSGAGGFFDEHSVVIAQCAAALAEYGVEPRHLRAFRSAADRQSDLIAQIAGPVGKAGTTGARDRADDLAREVAALAISLHTALIKAAVRDVMDR